MTTLSDGVFITSAEHPRYVYRVDTARGVAYQLNEDGTDGGRIGLQFFVLSDGYRVVGRPEKPKPHEIPGTLLKSPSTGNVVKVRSDGRLSYVHAGDEYGVSVGETISTTGVFPPLAKWTPVKAVTKTEYVPV